MFDNYQYTPGDTLAEFISNNSEWMDEEILSWNENGMQDYISLIKSDTLEDGVRTEFDVTADYILFRHTSDGFKEAIGLSDSDAAEEREYWEGIWRQREDEENEFLNR